MDVFFLFIIAVCGFALVNLFYIDKHIDAIHKYMMDVIDAMDYDDPKTRSTYSYRRLSSERFSVGVDNWLLALMLFRGLETTYTEPEFREVAVKSNPPWLSRTLKE